MKLTEDQCFTISSYLRTAAERFKEFSDACMQTPAQVQIANQFLKQRDEAMDLASKFTLALGAELTEEE